MTRSWAGKGSRRRYAPRGDDFSFLCQERGAPDLYFYIEFVVSYFVQAGLLSAPGPEILIISVPSRLTVYIASFDVQ